MPTETKEEIIAFFTSLIGGTEIDADLADGLLNNAKEIIESDRPWAFLIKEDSSKTFTPSDTYLTAKTLPTDFLEPYKVFVEDQEYKGFPFHLRRKNADVYNKYYINYQAGTYSITGRTDSTKTIYFFYVYQTPELDDDADEPVWPIKFRKLLAFLMAELYEGGVDYDAITALQAMAKNKQAKLIWDNMIAWDARIKLKEMNGQTNFADQGEGPRTDRIDTNE